MNISYYFKNLDSSDAMKEYASEKLNKLQERLHHIEGVDVRFKLMRQNQVCEITVHGDATVFHVNKQDKDMYAAIDLASDILNTQIDKYHKKVEGHRSDSALAILPLALKANTPEEMTIHVYDAPAKPMTDEEAILQLQSEKFKFHMYHHADEKKYSLVFARPDGNFSIISPTKELGQYQEKVVQYRHGEMKEISFSLYPLTVQSPSESIEALQENHLEYLAFVNEDTKRMNVLFLGKHGELAIKRPVTN